MTRSSFIFQENHGFIEEGNSQTKLIQLRKGKMELILDARKLNGFA